MIITELYDGQGLGNQLFCYVTTRVIAKDHDYDFGIKSPEKFKGLDFFNMNFGKRIIGGTGPEGGPPETLPVGIKYYYNERKVTHPGNGADIRSFDKNLVNVPDYTKIDGLMQDEQYFAHRKKEIRHWLQIKKGKEYLDFSDENTCVINFRGGEYVGLAGVYLTKKYWNNAISNMLKVHPKMQFVVITDDPPAASKFFPKFPVRHFSIGKDYSIINQAYYLILSNSTFAWFPAWLNTKVRLVIAPKYWARHNVSDGYWSCGYNITSDWMYQDRSGKLEDYKTCLTEFKKYLQTHKTYYPKSSVTVKNPEFVKRMIVDAKNLSGLRKRFFAGQKFTQAEINRTALTWPYDPDVNWGPKRLTLVPWSGLQHLHQCINDTVKRKVPGDFIEAGSWRGGVCILAKAIYDDLGVNKKVFVADSFEGLPKPNPQKYPNDIGDTHYLDENLKVSMLEVKRNFQKFNLLDRKVFFLKGWFKDTMPIAPINKLSILRLDGDMYESTIDVLYNLYCKLSIGGYCIIDDYDHRGCRAAVEDFRSANNISEPVEKAGHDTRSEVHFWIKEKDITHVKHKYPGDAFKHWIHPLANLLNR